MGASSSPENCGPWRGLGFESLTIRHIFITYKKEVVDGSQICSSKLRSKLLRDNLKSNECEECGLTEWQGKSLSVQLHHKDGDNYNNVLENLSMLCPNCHSQTDTWCNKK